MSDVLIKIKEYLSSGGLFNPELMEHEKVRDLIIECREELSSLKAQLKREMECVDFYAEGGEDLEPKPGKAYLYDQDYPMGSEKWLMRSMSDHWSGKLARETVKARGVASAVMR